MEAVVLGGHTNSLVFEELPDSYPQTQQAKRATILEWGIVLWVALALFTGCIANLPLVIIHITRWERAPRVSDQQLQPSEY